MRIFVLAVAVCLAVMGTSLGRGQEIEQVMPLPDTFFNVDGAEMVMYNPANDQFYLGSSGDSIAIAIDGTTCAKVAVLHLKDQVYGIGCNPATNKVYIGVVPDQVAVVDGCTNRLLTYLTAGEEPTAFACDTLLGKVYCADFNLPGITVIDATTDHVLKTIDLGNARPVALCCLPDAGRLYCCTDCGPVVVDTRSDVIVTREGTDEMDALGVVWSPVENRVYVGTGETLWVYDVATDSVRRRITPEGDWYFAAGLVYSAALDQVYTLDDLRGILQVIDCGSDSVVDAIPLVSDIPEGLGGLCADPFVGKVYCVDWALDCGYIVSCDAKRRTINSVTVRAEPSALAASPRARRLVAIDYTNGEGDALFLDTEHDSLVATVEVRDWTTAVLAGPTADRLYVGCFRGDLLVLDAQTGELLTRLDGANPITSLCLDPEGDRLYFAIDGLITDRPDSLKVFDTNADTLVAQYEIEGGRMRFCLASEQNKIYGLNEDHASITVIDGRASTIGDSVRLCDPPRLAWHDSVAGRLYVSHHHWEFGISVIDCERDSVISNVGLPGAAAALCGNSSRREVYASIQGRDTVYIIDGTRDSVTASVAVGGTPSSFCLDPARNRLYCALGNEVVEIDCAAREVVARIRVDGRPSGLWHNTPTGHLFCIVGTAVAVIDPATDSLVATIPVRGRPGSFSGSGAGNRVYVDCSCRFISVIRDPLPTASTCGAYGSTLFMGRVFLRSRSPTQLVNTTGRVVATLFPGDNDIRQLAAGVYFAVPTGSTRPTNRLVVLK